jgi:plasmid maintenance system antidote protein VapI
MSEKKAFEPDWITAPGDTIADLLEERSCSLAEFAQRMGCTPKHVKDLLHGHAPISIETARKLEVVLGVPADFWTTREAQYREPSVHRHKGMECKPERDWLSELPLKDMLRYGWLAPELSRTDPVGACLRFFAVPDLKAWRAMYRDVFKMASFRTSPSFNSRPAAVAAWLRQGEIEGYGTGRACGKAVLTRAYSR